MLASGPLIPVRAVTVPSESLAEKDSCGENGGPRWGGHWWEQELLLGIRVTGGDVVGLGVTAQKGGQWGRYSGTWPRDGREAPRE